jgi:hypothetical protein
MFFQENSINSMLICQYCKERYVDPRILPCGNNMCSGCIDVLENRGQHKIRCHFCNSEHVIPDEGFTKNIIISNLIGLNPKRVIRSKTVEEYEEVTKNYGLLLTQLEEQYKSSSSDNPVKEHCLTVRTQIDLVTETLIRKIEQFREDFLARLGHYETECIANLNNDTVFRDSIVKFLEETSGFYVVCNDDLKRFDLLDDHVEGQIRTAKEYLKSMEEKLAPLKIFELNKERPEFVSNDVSTVLANILGELKFHPLGEYFIRPEVVPDAAAAVPVPAP